MSRPGAGPRSETRFRPLVFAIVAGVAGLGALVSMIATARAQTDPGTVFDEAKADEKADKNQDADDANKPPPVSDRDTIGFGQEKISAQMTELEERMFRLSEALLGLEPENASRLRLALKFSREEQILDQMRETRSLLRGTQLGQAETEVKELVAKLEHLRDLLLAEDLDFQLKLARLRQMRETLGHLDRIIKEEKRELGWSRFAVDQRKGLDQLAALRPDLESLVRDQKTAIAGAKSLPEEDKAPSNGQKEGPSQGPAADPARDDLRGRETTIRSAAAALADGPLFAGLQPPHLRRAEGLLGDAAKLLEGTEGRSEVVAAMERALVPLNAELARLDQRDAEMTRTIAQAEFERRGKDQAKNRAATERLDAASSRLGDVGVALRKNLIHAGSSMGSAEGKLGKSAAGPAADDQSAALDVLTGARDEFAQSLDRLLVEIRAELRTRLVADLIEMHELQASVRETTQAQAPRILKKSRSALVLSAGLAKNEAELAQRAEHWIAMCEETEFGIALPGALRILSREMRRVEDWLKAGDAGPRTIALETRIEEDLLGMLQAVRKLPPTTPPGPEALLSGNARQRERELNRLIGELTMVRMLQSRLNDDTLGFDKARPGAQPQSLSADQKREIEALETTQDEIRETLAKIAERLELPDDGQ